MAFLEAMVPLKKKKTNYKPMILKERISVKGRALSAP